MSAPRCEEPGCRRVLTASRHSDNLNNLVIASVSLGAERTFIMSPRLPSRAGGNKLDPQVEEELQERKNVKWT